MKKIAFLLSFVCLLTALSGCGGKKEADPQALTEELLNSAGFSESLERLDDKVVPLLYGVEPEDYTAALVYGGAGGVTAEEIAVFTAADDAAADRLLSAMQTRVADRVESFKTYFPSAVPTLEKAIVKKSGSTVLLVVCSDSDAAAKIVNKYIG